MSEFASHLGNKSFSVRNLFPAARVPAVPFGDVVFNSVLNDIEEKSKIGKVDQKVQERARQVINALNRTRSESTILPPIIEVEDGGLDLYWSAFQMDIEISIDKNSNFLILKNDAEGKEIPTVNGEFSKVESNIIRSYHDFVSYVKNTNPRWEKTVKKTVRSR